MQGVPYVCVTLKAPQMAVTAFSAAHPHLKIDAFFGTPADERDGRLGGAFLLSGAAPADMAALLATLRSTYERVDVVAELPGAGEMLCTFVGPAIASSHSITAALHPLDQRFDKPWVHVEGDVMEIRLVPLMDPDLLVLESAVRSRLAEIGVEAQVRVSHLDFSAYGKWKRLVAAHAEARA